MALRPRLSPGVPLSKDGITDVRWRTKAVKHARPPCRSALQTAAASRQSARGFRIPSERDTNVQL
jgi:hypothetical protein